MAACARVKAPTLLPPQHIQMAVSSQGAPQIMGQAANVGPCSAAHAHDDPVWRRKGQQVELVHGHTARRRSHNFTAPSPDIERLAILFDGREGGRCLLDLALESCQRQSRWQVQRGVVWRQSLSPYPSHRRCRWQSPARFRRSSSFLRPGSTRPGALRSPDRAEADHWPWDPACLCGRCGVDHSNGAPAPRCRGWWAILPPGDWQLQAGPGKQELRVSVWVCEWPPRLIDDEQAI